MFELSFSEKDKTGIGHLGHKIILHPNILNHPQEERCVNTELQPRNPKSQLLVQIVFIDSCGIKFLGDLKPHLTTETSD